MQPPALRFSRAGGGEGSPPTRHHPRTRHRAPPQRQRSMAPPAGLLPDSHGPHRVRRRREGIPRGHPAPYGPGFSAEDPSTPNVSACSTQDDGKRSESRRNRGGEGDGPPGTRPSAASSRDPRGAVRCGDSTVWAKKVTWPRHVRGAYTRKHRGSRCFVDRSRGCGGSHVGWCPGTESNCRHADFQSAALPSELPGQPGGGFITQAPRAVNGGAQGAPRRRPPPAAGPEGHRGPRAPSGAWPGRGSCPGHRS